MKSVLNLLFLLPTCCIAESDAVYQLYSKIKRQHPTYACAAFKSFPSRTRVNPRKDKPWLEFRSGCSFFRCQAYAYCIPARELGATLQPRSAIADNWSYDKSKFILSKNKLIFKFLRGNGDIQGSQ
ncbi:hypothetical protein DSO57_1005942 [Entomophthora muscae]|uniref:Uncharacterized protein n=1 Tax=Entomophthora muscae TaxID=34485 RepID=A0ACC2RYY1_9FUNG|nr:hypothetical protein DSO57_1005942 [Entomophthora muscae]